MLSNCGAGEDSWESLGLNQSRKSTLNTHWNDWCWSWSSSILVIWCEQLTHWKSLWCWERLRTEEEGVRGWDGWMASLIQWTWKWANFKRWWGIGRPCVLQSMGLERVRHDWAAEQNQHKSKPSNKILKTMILTCTFFRNSWSIRKHSSQRLQTESVRWFSGKDSF